MPKTAIKARMKKAMKAMKKMKRARPEEAKGDADDGVDLVSSVCGSEDEAPPMKKVMKTPALQKTDTMTKIVGNGDQELWSKVSVKDIPEMWVVTKRDKNEIGHDVYGMLKKKSTFKIP